MFPPVIVAMIKGSPRHDPIFNSQLKYKRRVYKMLHLDEKQLKAMHTRTNLRRLLEYVANSQVEKIAKMCSKGLDPNFHCQETGGKEKKKKTPGKTFERISNRNCSLRDSAHVGHHAEEALEGDNSTGERWRVARLSNEGGPDGDASGRRAEQPGSGEDVARAGREPQLQGHEGVDAALLQRHLQNRPDAVRNVAPRPRDHRRPGFAGMAGSAPGFTSLLFPTPPPKEGRRED